MRLSSAVVMRFLSQRQIRDVSVGQVLAFDEALTTLMIRSTVSALWVIALVLALFVGNDVLKFLMCIATVPLGLCFALFVFPYFNYLSLEHHRIREVLFRIRYVTSEFQKYFGRRNLRQVMENSFSMEVDDILAVRFKAYRDENLPPDKVFELSGALLEQYRCAECLMPLREPEWKLLGVTPAMRERYMITAERERMRRMA